MRFALGLALLASTGSVALAAPTRDGITIDSGPSSIHFTAPAFAPGDPPCDGNNHLHDLYFDAASMGGPLIGISWLPAATETLSRVEVFTGETTASNYLAIWSDDGGAPSKPLSALGVTGAFMVAPPNAWYGADLLTNVTVTGGQLYWIVWDPAGGEQCSCTDLPTDTQQTYWGSDVGDVNGGASWFGPFSFPDRRWKFRLFCDGGGGGGCPDSDRDGVCDDVDLCPDTVVPEPVDRLGVNRFAMMDGDDTFDTTEPNGVGPKVTFTLADTGGCSCRQIAEALHVGDGHDKYGCSVGIMRRWVEMVSP